MTAFSVAALSSTNGKPTVIYTAVAPPAMPDEATLRDGAHTWRETQCLAVAQDDELRNWKKLPEPVIAAPPAGLAVTGFRDPCLWREGKRWMLILGSGVAHRGGSILLYSSPDLRTLVLSASPDRRHNLGHQECQSGRLRRDVGVS